MIKNKTKQNFKHTGFVFASLLTVQFASAQTEPTYQGKIGKTLAESKEWWPEPVKAPKDAPNVIWILLDDVGFGTSSSFGGLIPTPTMDSLANNGLRYTNFHTEDTLHNDWHLYNLNEDFNELTDLAKKYPEKLTELKALFDSEATKNRLYPLINWDDVVRKVMNATDAQRRAPLKPKDE